MSSAAHAESGSTSPITAPNISRFIATSVAPMCDLTAALSRRGACFEPVLHSRNRLSSSHARGDRSDDPRGLVECRGIHALDVVATRDIAEIGVRGPNVSLFVLEHEQPHGPVEPRKGISGDEQRAERRVAEYQQRRRAQCYAGVARELGLI